MNQKLVKISDLFDVKYGTNLELIALEEVNKKNNNSINFISRTEKNNGVSAFVEKVSTVVPNPARTISVAGGGSVLATFYQNEEYYSGRDLYILHPKRECSELEMLFYVFCIRQNKYRYNYGRQANKTLRDILIPEKIPEEWTEVNIGKLKPEIKPMINKKLDLNNKTWKWFKTIDLFDEISIAKSTDLNTLEQSSAGIPYIGRSRENNGTTAFIENNLSNLDFINKKNCLTVAMVGDSTCYAFWQRQDFIASQNILILRSELMNGFNALFLSEIIYIEKYRFSYGRTLSKSFFETIRIKLPATEKGQPDWDFMEKYIKSLPYSSSL